MDCHPFGFFVEDEHEVLPRDDHPSEEVWHIQKDRRHNGRQSNYTEHGFWVMNYAAIRC